MKTEEFTTPSGLKGRHVTMTTEEAIFSPELAGSTAIAAVQQMIQHVRSLEKEIRRLNGIINGHAEADKARADRLIAIITAADEDAEAQANAKAALFALRHPSIRVSKFITDQEGRRYLVTRREWDPEIMDFQIFCELQKKDGTGGTGRESLIEWIRPVSDSK